MPELALSAIKDEDFRERLTQAREAYLGDRNSEGVELSVGVLVDLLRADPGALVGTRLDEKNFRSAFPNLGVTLHNRGTADLKAEYDGRTYTMSEAIYYYEYSLE